MASNNDELQLPMDMQVGFINKLDVNAFRRSISEVETEIDGNQPLLVFDNHDNPRMDARYGDGKHNMRYRSACWPPSCFASRAAPR